MRSKINFWMKKNRKKWKLSYLMMIKSRKRKRMRKMKRRTKKKKRRKTGRKKGRISQQFMRKYTRENNFNTSKSNFYSS